MHITLTPPALFRRAFPLFPALCLAAALLCASSCVTEEVAENTRRGNFETLWKIFDEHYCFFPEKQAEYGLDWNAVRGKYAPAVTEDLSDRQLFEVLGNMAAELRDGHVNLYAPHDVARYGRWYDDYPANYSDTLTRRYLGRTEDYHTAAGLSYRTLDDNLGYVRCASFASSFGDGNLQEMMRALALCDGLIVDVRSNGGGLLTAAEKLASLFVNEEGTAAYMCHKTGKGHSDFSTPQPVRLSPFRGLRWQKPVAVLANRRTYSAANSFVMYLKGLPLVTIVGDRTGGGAGMPFTAELPNGWSVRFSACPMYDRSMRLTETGIDPDVRADQTDEDFRRSEDTLIETARRLLRSRTR